MHDRRQEDRGALEHFGTRNSVGHAPTMVQLAALMSTVSLLTFAALVFIFELARSISS